LILRRCGCGVVGRMAGLENILMGVSYLHPIFFSEFFGECNLLDFAVMRMWGWSSGVAMRGAECSTLFGIFEFAPKPNFELTCGFKKIEKLLYLFMHSNFRQASFKYGV